jgi:hypothetical protein
LYIWKDSLKGPKDSFGGCLWQNPQPLDPYFREIISSINPDIIGVQEITSQAGVDGFNNIVLLKNYYKDTFIICDDAGNSLID